MNVELSGGFLVRQPCGGRWGGRGRESGTGRGGGEGLLLFPLPSCLDSVPNVMTLAEVLTPGVVVWVEERDGHHAWVAATVVSLEGEKVVVDLSGAKSERRTLAAKDCHLQEQLGGGGVEVRVVERGSPDAPSRRWKAHHLPRKNLKPPVSHPSLPASCPPTEPVSFWPVSLAPEWRIPHSIFPTFG